MKVTTEITHDDLDDLIDEGDDQPQALVHATIGDSSGMRWAGSCGRAGVEQMTPEQYAEALVAIERWLRVPDELVIE